MNTCFFDRFGVGTVRRFHTLQTYLQHFVGDGAERILEDLDGLLERIGLVDLAHERYLSARQLKPD